ncbi:hypothetical protein FB45DRAFT_947491 [Roridomyces roridus]|uniref:Protein kinase domain-containing protein n=1 Tax=Roridomyces roridus TaxID=1738132 RepID=A0AAD7B264_9AGAR|nr:hypothetical protein FB45DRAFT_947491 [Roridomyces roridus]
MDTHTPSRAPSDGGAPPESSEPAGFAGAFFPHSRHVRVTGGNFTSHHVHNTVDSPHEHFKWIGRGEIDLQREISLDDHLAMSSRRRGGVIRRRMFSATIQERTERSVLLFNGENAEEDCRQYISRHARLWHPNILQIFGVSEICGTHVVIVHDDLMPYEDYWDLRQPSTILRIYLLALWQSEYLNVYAEIGIGSSDVTQWICGSSGRLCIDLERTDIRGPSSAFPALDSNRRSLVDWNDFTSETKALEVLSISDFHLISAAVFGQRHHFFFRAGQHTDMRVGTVLLNPTRSWLLENRSDNVEVAFLPDRTIECGPWEMYRARETIMDDGWTRFNSEEIFRNSETLNSWSHNFDIGEMWMSQANHTFKRLQVISAHDAYILIDTVFIDVDVTKLASSTENSGGYLFLCPPEDFLTSSNCPRWPECRWFWSFDPFGQDRLSAEEARSHGFPEVEMDIAISGRSWDTSVYEALRTFHAFKGFDPDSQELAIHLGQPLFQLSGEKEESFAHVCEVQVQTEDELPTESSEGIALDELTDAEEASGASGVPHGVVASDAAVRERKLSNWITSLWDWETPEFGSLC